MTLSKVIYCYMTSFYGRGVMSCHVVLWVSCGVMWRYVLISGAIWLYVALCGAMWRYVALHGGI